MTSRRIFTITGAFIIAAAPLAAFAQWSGAPGTPPGNNIPGPVWLQGSSPTTQSGHFSVTGGRFSDDIYELENNKALRVDGLGARTFNISNYHGGGTDTFTLGVRGNLTLTPLNGTPGVLSAPQICLNGDCRTSWPTGTAADIWVNTTGDAMTGQLNVTATANPLSTNAAIQGIFSVAGGAGVRGYGTGSGGTGLYGAGEAYGGVFSITNDSGYDIGVYASGGLEEGVRGYGSSYGVRGIGGSEGGNFEGVTGATGYGSSIGLFGYNTVAGGYGVYGRAPLDGSVGVRARADGANSAGLIAQGNGTNSNGIEAAGYLYGVYAESGNSAAFRGSGYTYGGYFEARSISGSSSYGVYAQGNAYGGRFISGSAGVGVQGEGGNYGAVFSASASSGQGVRAQGGGYGGYFIGTGSSGIGVLGRSDSYAVKGESPWIGVHGSGGSVVASTGVYGSGYVGVEGNGETVGVQGSGNIGASFYGSGGIGLRVTNGAIRASDGNASAPGYGFNNDGDTGIFRSGGNSIGFSAGGTNRVNLTTTAFSATVPFYGTFLRADNGSAAIPGFSFKESTNTGMYYDTSGSAGISFSVGGQQRVKFTNQVPYAYKTSGGSWGVLASDGRLKNITRPFTYGLDEILQLNPIYYTFKEGNPDGNDPTVEHLGFIAQEVQEVMPEMIGVREDGYLNIKSFDPIFWGMLNGMKELKAENDSLKSELNDLKSRLEKLEAAIAN